LFLESKEAHKLFEEADRKLKDIQRKISDLQKSLINNYGLENEFAALYEQCYELTNQEYTYKLCLFEKVMEIINYIFKLVILKYTVFLLGNPKVCKRRF
jgi:hypothetical protein